jgi:hypothetical protein
VSGSQHKKLHPNEKERIMKRVSLVFTTAAVFVCLSGIPLLAQHARGGGGMGGGMDMGRGSMSEPGSMGSHAQPGTEGTSTIHGPQMGTNGSTLSKKSPTDLLSQNTKLSSNLQTLLPGGTNLQDAASGFKNLGEFVAAVHVSHNLGIPFDQLKTTMESNGDNLGKAIHTLNPNLSTKESKSDAKKAEKEANRDIREANNS